MLDFDKIDDWAPKFSRALSQHFSDSISKKLQFHQLEFVEEALDLLFKRANRDNIIDAVLELIRSEEIACYHGTRLTDAEVISIRSNGLKPLKAEDRLHRLTRALSLHRKWPEVAGQLVDVVQAHGRGGSAGHREAQVHLTLSKAGLTKGFNHYLTYGSEFDQNVARTLLGQEGLELLSRDGKPSIIRVSVPGSEALDAAHPYFNISDLRARGDVPNLVVEFLESWSYRLAYPVFQSATLKADCGMIFHSPVAPAWIVDIETLAE